MTGTFTCPVSFISDEVAFVLGTRASFTPMGQPTPAGVSGTLSIDVPSYADPRSYAKQLFGILHLVRPGASLFSFDVPDPGESTSQPTITTFVSGKNVELSMEAKARIKGFPFTVSELAGATLAVSALDSMTSDALARHAVALETMRSITMERSQLSKFKQAWTGLEALLRTSEHKKVPIKRLFNARYAGAFSRSVIDKRIDDVYVVRCAVDHEDYRDHPALGTATNWTARAFSEALAQGLGIEIGRELQF